MAAHIERALGKYGFIWDPTAEAYTFREVDETTGTVRIEILRAVGLTFTIYGLETERLVDAMLKESKKALDQAIPEGGGV